MRATWCKPRASRHALVGFPSLLVFFYSLLHCDCSVWLISCRARLMEEACNVFLFCLMAAVRRATTKRPLWLRISARWRRRLRRQQAITPRVGRPHARLGCKRRLQVSNHCSPKLFLAAAALLLSDRGWIGTQQHSRTWMFDKLQANYWDALRCENISSFHLSPLLSFK